MLKTYVTFKASLPDDGEWDSNGNVIQPSGRSVAETIVGLLRSRGLTTSLPSTYRFYGWQFDVTDNETRAWAMLQHPEPWLMMIEARPSFRQRLSGTGDQESLSRLLSVVDEEFRADKRFSDISWFTKDEYDHQFDERR